MNRFVATVPCSTLLLGACVSAPPQVPSDAAGQAVDVSGFVSFQFEREVTLATCFEPGDLLSVHLTTQVDNRLLEVTTLVAAGDESACVTTAADGTCLVGGARTSRILEPLENALVTATFADLVVADEPNPLCRIGNIALCSDDRYRWDDLELSGDICAAVHLATAPTLMAVLSALRDGPGAGTLPADGLDGTQPARLVEVLRVLPLFDSDPVLDGRGDYVVVEEAGDWKGAMALGIDFGREVGVVVTVLRGPCQVFDAEFAVENLLTLDINATLQPDQRCTNDQGGVEVYVVVLPRSSRAPRLFLNGTELRAIDPS